jgi:hypothetical protein
MVEHSNYDVAQLRHLLQPKSYFRSLGPYINCKNMKYGGNCIHMLYGESWSDILMNVPRKQ